MSILVSQAAHSHKQTGLRTPRSPVVFLPIVHDLHIALCPAFEMPHPGWQAEFIQKVRCRNTVNLRQPVHVLFWDVLYRVFLDIEITALAQAEPLRRFRLG